MLQSEWYTEDDYTKPHSNLLFTSYEKGLKEQARWPSTPSAGRPCPSWSR